MPKCNYLAEEYYQKINSEVNLVSSYLEDKIIKEIIIKCRLKPYQYNAQFGRKLILRRHWVDEFGNSLLLEGNKIKIIENNLSINQEEIKNTDLYQGLEIDKIAKISKLAHLYYGKDEDALEDCLIVTFLGIDNYLRTFCWYQFEWQRFSPLSLGIKNLKKIIENEDIKLFKKINSSETVIYPCLKKEEWILSLPMHKFFWEETELTKKQLYFLGDEHK
jgi:hypothetical protein